jgi:predicted unusual protein kinase regulating ubiquinone biosynthesis (AarF/ABC1/UbiB family)
VHRCTLRDGRECAVKLQYAEAQRQFGADFANVARLAR